MFVRTKQRGTHTYLMIVENKRVDGRIQQTVLHHLGRLDRLRASGQLDALFHSLGRFSEDLDVLGKLVNALLQKKEKAKKQDGTTTYLRKWPYMNPNLPRLIYGVAIY